MPSRTEADRRHATYYFGIFSQLAQTLQDESRARFTTDYDQITRSHSWAAAHLKDNLTATTLCVLYPILGQNAMDWMPASAHQTWLAAATSARAVLREEEVITGAKTNGDVIQLMLNRANEVIKFLEQIPNIKEMAGAIAGVTMYQLLGEMDYMQREEARTLANQVRQLIFLKKFPEAVKVAQQALALAERSKDNSVKLAAYGAMGTAYRANANLPQAITYQQKVLDLAQANNLTDPTHYLNLGLALCDAKEYEKAVKHYQDGLKLAHTTKQAFAEATLLNAIGIAHNVTQQFGKATTFLYDAQRIYRSLNNPTLQAQTLANLATAYGGLEDFDRAVTHFEEARQIFIEREHHQFAEQAQRDIHRMRSSKLFLQARNLVDSGQSKEALGLLETARAAIVAMDDPALLASMDAYMNDVRSGKGQTTTVVVSKEFKDRWCKLDTLPSHQFLLQGDFQRANEVLVQLLQQSQAFPSPMGVMLEMPAMRGLGILATEVGNVELAMEGLKRANHLAWSTGDPSWQAITYADLGRLNTLLHDFVQANTFWDYAISYAQQMGDDQLVTFCQVGLAENQRIEKAPPSQRPAKLSPTTALAGLQPNTTSSTAAKPNVAVKPLVSQATPSPFTQKKPEPPQKQPAPPQKKHPFWQFWKRD